MCQTIALPRMRLASPSSDVGKHYNRLLSPNMLFMQFQVHVIVEGKLC